MATIPVRGSDGNEVDIELPLTPGRSAAATSRPVVLSNEDIARIRPRLGASVDLNFGAVAVQSAALTGTMVRLVAKTAACRVKIGAAPTAVATDTLIPVGVPEVVTITTGDVVSAIGDAGASGTLNVTVVS